MANFQKREKENVKKKTIVHNHNVIYIPLRLPIRILKELLLTYSDADASEGKSYAEELIKLVILDPSSFIFDDILELPPIKALADQNIHNVRKKSILYYCNRMTNVTLFMQLLKIFVFDYLSSFETFYSQHKAFVDELGTLRVN